MARTRADFNWALPARIALVASLLFAGWVLWPATECTARIMQGAQLGGLSDDDEFNEWLYTGQQYRQDANADVRRVSEGSGFLAQFFGSVGVCYRIHPVERQEPWKWQAAGGAFGFFLLFTFAGRASRRRAARRTADYGRRDRKVPGEGTGTAQRPKRISNAQPLVPGGNELSTPAPRTRAHHASAEHLAVQSLDAGLSGAHTAARAPAMPAAPLKLGDGLDDELDALLGIGGGGARTPEAPAAPGAQPAAPRRPSETSLFDDDDLFGDAIGGGRPQAPTAAHVTARGNAQETDDDLRYHELGEQTARNEIAASHRRVGMRAPATWYIGTPLRLAIATETPSLRILQGVRVAVSVIESDATVRPVWSAPIPLADLQNADQLASIGRALVDVPHEDLVRLCALDASENSRTLRIQLLVDDDEIVANVKVQDRICLEFETDAGAPLAPVAVQLRSRSGHVLRAAVGTDVPGRFVAGPLAPGRYQLRFEEHMLVRAGGGVLAHAATVDSDGHARARGVLDADAGIVRRLVVVPPLDVFVDTSAGDDTEAAVGGRTPFRTIRAALTAGLQARGDEDRVLVVHLQGAGLTARQRASLIASGASPSWLAWWEGRTVSAATEWTTPMSPAALREAVAAQVPGGTFVEDIVLEEMRNIVFTNARWTDTRQRAARDAATSASLDTTLRQHPLTMLTAPIDAAHRHPSRIHLRSCRGIRFEGLHFHGVGGQAGVLVEGCEDIEFRHCWLDAFEAGKTPQSAVYATGRALTIRDSGHQHDPIVIEHCDISYNAAVRPSVPISGAALDASTSYLTLRRSTIHDNRANGEPIDISVDRNSVLTGDANNHRAGNRLVNR